ncbi:hypothetical protein DTO164E3_7307 [Paecilomyces variotii]|nr:hypothetical protein DTO164E3_7307 [Paecilomyces variotii]KAJ9208187.1 hypothetical protein DTO032I3_858 [Paecilomyces variotii]KAJ9282079.1 hypothetical protein DTO021D3_831 [Paecilomyces variotii]KAJ9343581.1 hypothetical protein DTO027B6_3799 [Paecilomyces variotii]KAJ9383052.1 hypothetical protein DTO032I4_5319 [Paecilomyces variotii]
MQSQPRIAIVGGGPAGLTLGALLHKHRIPFTIFELRQKPTEEQLAQPSGMLDLHEESGLAAIRECGSYDKFVPLVGECSEDFIVSDKNGNILHTHRGDGARPEISRNNLNKLLLDNVPADSISWGQKLISATKPSNSTGTETLLDFGTHGQHKFDLVGDNQKIPASGRPGSGTFSSLGNKHAVMSQRGPIDSSRIYLWLSHLDEDFATTSGLADKAATSAKDKLLTDNALLGNFGSPIKELVATACEEEAADHPGESLDIRALYTLPYGTSWVHNPGVTLVGDAAHLMLPNGEGVNQGMLDSLLLSQAIVKAYETAEKGLDSFQDAFDPLLKEFETALVERAKEIGNETETLIKTMLGSDDAAHNVASFFKSITQQQPEN